MSYIALLRGVNVGGKNKVPMSELKSCFEQLGYANVRTYINSGNVLFDSDDETQAVVVRIEQALPTTFKLDSGLIRVLVLSHDQLEAVVTQAPVGFGSQPEMYHSDVAFLIGVSAAEAMQQIETNPAVDSAWPGDGVIYYQRLSAQRTKSRLSKIVAKPIYKSMTIRNWRTTTKLLAMIS